MTTRHTKDSAKQAKTAFDCGRTSTFTCDASTSRPFLPPLLSSLLLCTPTCLLVCCLPDGPE